MQYPVKHTCSHTITHNLTGTGSERERRAAWLKDQPCLQCKRAQEAAKDQLQAETQRFPALVGSEKQVAWAQRIRAEKVEDVESLWEELAKAERSGKYTAEQLTTARQSLEGPILKMLAQTDASWWIDHRSDSARQILRELS